MERQKFFILRAIMNKLVLFFCLLFGFSLCSCNSNKTTSKAEALDTIWNEKVQDSFYGLKLGTTMCVEQIVNTIENQGFYFDKEYSTGKLLHLKIIKRTVYSFLALELLFRILFETQSHASMLNLHVITSVPMLL